MRHILTWSLLLFACAAQAQMLNDSTLQCVSYWGLDESHIYQVKEYKQKVSGEDTLTVESYAYKVKVNVVDSTATSYTMLWHYYDYEIEQADSMLRMLMGISNQMDVVFDVSETGVFQSVKNALELKEFIYQGLDSVAKMYSSIPQMDALVANLKSTFSSRESIERSSIEEILLFQRVFGSRFELNTTYDGDVKLANTFGGEPFDAKQQSDVYEVDPENSTAIIRVFTDVDKQQATEGVYNYLVNLANTMKVPAPKREDVPELTIEHRYFVNLFLPSGWPIYIYNVKDVSAGGEQQLDNTEITFLE